MTTTQVDSTRDQIKQVALDLFSAQGYSKTSLREIAERMHFTKAALYYHFRTKDDLLQELMAPLLDDADTLLSKMERGVDDPGDDAPSPSGWVDRYIAMLLTHRDVAPLLASDLSVLSHPGVGTRILAQGERLQTLLAGVDPDDAAKIRAQAAISVISSAISLNWADEATIRRELVAATMAVLQHGGIAAG